MDDTSLFRREGRRGVQRIPALAHLLALGSVSPASWASSYAVLTATGMAASEQERWQLSGCVAREILGDRRLKRICARRQHSTSQKSSP